MIRGETVPDTVDALREMVREASGARAPIRLVGGGTWLDAGRPVRGAEPVSLGALAGIVAYTPGDLTITLRAGTTMAEIDRVTAEHGQWLGLDPFGSPSGTIGATIATASAGPLASGIGLVRDLVLGVALVTGTGDVVRGGGRVVKNVAGFDLTRLAVGSWGTLGALTEVTLRLRARPDRDVTIALGLPADGSLGTLPLRLRESAVVPIAIEALSASVAARCGLGAGAVVLVRVAGNAESVAAQEAVLRSLGDARAVEPSVWESLRRVEPEGATVVRFSLRPSRIADTWRAALSAAAAIDGALVHASLGRGVARCILPGAEPNAIRAALGRVPGGGGAFAGTRVFERLPDALWVELAPSAAADQLSRGVKRAFDPGAILNPGILGDDGS